MSEQQRRKSILRPCSFPSTKHASGTLSHYRPVTQQHMHRIRQSKMAIHATFFLFWMIFTTVHSYSTSLLFPRRSNKPAYSYSYIKPTRRLDQPAIRLDNNEPTLSSTEGSDNSEGPTSLATSFDSILLNRYACTRFQRYDGIVETVEEPSTSDPDVVQDALECLDLSRRAPSGFNAQPYKLILVKSPQQKKALARYCIGHNAHRVRDSDCTAVFLADRETARTIGAYKSFVVSNSPQWKNRKWGMLKVQALIALFSSGYPLPRFLAVPISFGVRLAVCCLSVFTFRKVLVPTLSNAETWSSKNTMLVAMSYMLACTSRGWTTCPMEGFNAGGIRKALGIPRRFSIPIIVSTGRPYIRPEETAITETDTSDDMGMTHGSPAKGSKNSTPRYNVDSVVYQDRYGESSAA